MFGIPIVIAAAFGLGISVSGGDVMPVPSHLTDACKAQTVKVANSNYSYTSFEHCLKK